MSKKDKEQEPIWNSKAGDPEQDPLYYDKTNSPRVVSYCKLYILIKTHHNLFYQYNSVWCKMPVWRRC